MMIFWGGAKITAEILDHEIEISKEAFKIGSIYQNFEDD